MIPVLQNAHQKISLQTQYPQIKFKKFIFVKSVTVTLSFAPNKERKCACTARKLGATVTWRMYRTLPIAARTQLRTFFLMFGETRSVPGKCICPLSKVY